MTEQRPRKRLYSHVTRSRFLHVEDALSIGKVRLFAGEYRKGSGASATAHHFLDLDDARPLLADLSWGKKVEFTDYKGTSSLGTKDAGDSPQSRVLKIKSNGDKVWLEIQNGPGEIVGQGAVKPKDKPTAAVSIPLTVWESRKLAHACLAYIRAWESAHLLDVTPTGPVDGDSQTPDRSGSPAIPAPSVATHRTGPSDTCPVRQVQGTVLSPEATGKGQGGGEIEENVTGYWSYYNTIAKPAGVTYPHALNIANKHGDDWKIAIAKLQAAAKA